jgi:hypothetical protein
MQCMHACTCMAAKQTRGIRWDLVKVLCLSGLLCVLGHEVLSEGRGWSKHGVSDLVCAARTQWTRSWLYAV